MIAQTKNLLRLTILDAALLTAACLIPTASHLFALPIYMLNPMLALLLAGILLGRDWRNALVLAMLLPAVSSLLTGMPAFPKMVCMMAELATVATLFGWLGSRWRVWPAVMVAVVGGKVVYYALKAIVLAPAVLIDTNWMVQVLTILIWGGLFALLFRRCQ